MSAPSQVTRPWSGRYSPAITLASVVFPEPFSPTSATTSPAFTSIVTSRRLGLAWLGYVKDTVSALSTANGSGAGSSAGPAEGEGVATKLLKSSMKSELWYS